MRISNLYDDLKIVSECTFTRKLSIFVWVQPGQTLITDHLYIVNEFKTFSNTQNQKPVNITDMCTLL